MRSFVIAISRMTQLLAKPVSYPHLFQMDFWAALSRKKSNCDDGSPSKLHRVLGLVDLTALGVGTTLGLGVYVLAGSVARTLAGPGVVLSFLIAAFASAIAGLCYAEFAARVPKAGSAYIYSYVSVGEFIAFLIGWNLILEYIIGTASVARGFTSYLDTLIDHKIEETLTAWFPIGISFMSKYVDVVSFILVIILTVLLSVGVEESSKFNNAFTVLNLFTIVVCLVGGGLQVDPANWQIEKSAIPTNVTWAGEGGFLPFGFGGVLAGAAKCFYGFVGFDSIATTGEEARNPQRDVPLSIVLSLTIIFFAYFGISTVLTLAWPYYDQDKDAPLPVLFDNLGWPALKWIVTIGALCALSTSLMGAMFPLPRILYAMGEDGLIFKICSKVHPKFKTPLVATIISGVFSGLMAAIFDLDELIEMMSIGTLLAYTIVAICVLVLRYEPEEKNGKVLENNEFHNMDIQYILKTMFNLNNNKYASLFTSALTKLATAFFTVLSVIFCLFLVFASDRINPSEPLILILFVFVTLSLLLNMIIIGRQPVDEITLSFKVPLVPLIPCTCVIINTYLMLKLNGETWIRFAVWLLLGFLIYFCYGIKHSNEVTKHKTDSNGISNNSNTMQSSKL